MELELILFVDAGATICDQCPAGSSSAVIGRFLVLLGLIRICASDRDTSQQQNLDFVLNIFVEQLSIVLSH